jgi:hypothetical protein
VIGSPKPTLTFSNHAVLLFFLSLHWSAHPFAFAHEQNERLILEC